MTLFQFTNSIIDGSRLPCMSGRGPSRGRGGSHGFVPAIDGSGWRKEETIAGMPAGRLGTARLAIFVAMHAMKGLSDRCIAFVAFVARAISAEQDATAFTLDDCPSRIAAPGLRYGAKFKEGKSCS